MEEAKQIADEKLKHSEGKVFYYYNKTTKLLCTLSSSIWMLLPKRQISRELAVPA